MNWFLLQNSLVVAGAATFLATVIGLTASLFAAASPRQIQRVLQAISLLVLALPPFLVTNTWMHYFGLAGVLRPFINWNIYSLGGTVLLLSLCLWPISFLLCSSALAGIPQAAFETDSALRGSRLLRWLIMPAMKGVLFLGTAVTSILAFNHFTIPSLLQVKVYPAELWLKFNINFNYWEALTLCWPMALGPLALLALTRKTRFRFFAGKPIDHSLFRKYLGPFWTWLSATVVLPAIFLSAFLPLFQLATAPRTFLELWPALLAGKAALFNSLIIASLAAVAILLLSILLQRQRIIGPIAWMVYLAPGVILGIALVFLLNRPVLNAFYQSLAMVIFGLCIRFLAPVWTGWRLAEGSIPLRWMETFQILGGSPWHKFRFLYGPILAPQAFALFFVAYILCLWDVETLIFIIPAGRETLAIRIFNMLHYGHAEQVNALCVIMLGAALLPMAIYLISQSILAKKLTVMSGLVLPVVLLASGCGDEKPSALQSDFFNEIKVLGTRGTGAGQFNKPRSVIVDRERNIFVMDITGRMQKFTREMKYSLAWQMPETDIGKPKGMTLDQDGNVVLVEPHYNRVNHFSSAGKLIHQWGKAGRSEGEFVFPRSIAITKTGESFLSEYGLAERIQRFSRDGRDFLGAFGERGTGPGQFNRVEGIGVDEQNRIYAADSCNHRIQIFSAEGKWLGEFGKAGSALGELSYPYDVRVDRFGNKFVCEFGNSRIQIFGPDNQPLEIIGTAGSEVGNFFNPWSIALDESGNLYVADSGNHRVQIFTRKPIEPKQHPAEITAAPPARKGKGAKPGRS